VGRRRRSPITLSEDDGVRYLHFGTEWVQGGMRIARPFALELEYQRQMMALALLIPQPRRIVQLGLGAAALTKFCLRHVESAQVTVVEISQAVIDAARAWFLLPKDDERLTVVVADAREYMTARRPQRADWLQVDLYDAAARGPVYDDFEFYRSCRRSLGKPGVAAFNLFGSSFENSFASIAKAFSDRVLVLSEVEEGNRIVLAAAGPVIKASSAELDRRAGNVESAWKLPAGRWVADLLRANGDKDQLSI
jgi:spermidine synthase